jgi:hypothetical protein
MTHKKHEIAVFIENEEVLQLTKKFLIERSQNIDEDMFDLHHEVVNNFLLYSTSDDEWYVSFITDEIKIPPNQLEEILKNQ